MLTISCQHRATELEGSPELAHRLEVQLEAQGIAASVCAEMGGQGASQADGTLITVMSCQPACFLRASPDEMNQM